MKGQRTTVVDASVVVQWYMPEVDSDRAVALLEQAWRGERELLAPDLLFVEVANAAWKRVRRGGMSPEEAVEVARRVQTAPVSASGLVDLVPRATEIATAFDCTVYDSLYLALAEAYDATLITADRRLCEKVPEEWRAARIQMLTEVAL